MSSPSDWDTGGSHLPIVRVVEEGTFSAAFDFEARPNMGEAPDGPTEFTGRCQDGWEGPVIEG